MNDQQNKDIQNLSPKYGYIYKTTNNINGKIYIGRHMSYKYDRWYLGSGSKIRAAIEKYGDDNFSNELLCWCYSEEELNEKEIAAISYYNSTDPNIGYNISKGGTKGNWLADLSPEEAAAYRQKFSMMSKTGICGNKGKHLSEKHKQRISESNKGRVFSEEHIQKLSKAFKGKRAWNKGLTSEDERVQKYVRKPGTYTHSAETRAKMKESASKRDNSNIGKATKGKIWIHNGNKSTMIYPELLPEYEDKGYIKGRGGFGCHAKLSSKI